MWTPKRVVIIALLALTTVGVVLSLRGGSEQTLPTAGSAPASVPPGLTDTAEADTSTTEIAGVSVDVDGQPLPAAPPAPFEQSADGARTAAVTYLESTETAVTLQPAEAAAWARESASVAYADEFAADTEAQMIELLDTIPAGIILRLAPIATRVDPDGDGWRVSVWFVQAITIGTEGVVDDWRTTTYRMVWEADTWKIDEFRSERGPTPGRGTTPASETPAGFEALLVGFDDEGLS